MNTKKLGCINEAQLKHLKRELVTLLQQLQADLDAERLDQQEEKNQLSCTEVLDRAEASAVVGLQQTGLSHMTQLEEEIRECQNALSRVEAGQYGYCQSCAEEIELNRLMANPTAILCVACQSKEELRRKGGSL
ncbi:TraR/DksA family transcriptional regulator [Amphritea sp. 1_MG-2023]|uniref:TraR/DksA family transcriptional regulator n=1 Tax=Amphritea sp. 1_MG-2023 TaxID=3062670 RepID=UPI0026E44920|nr:TraR/DksA family transcriptional regulator [Amphritea sp. 1_MG-2023]MDO6562571.1 TraR/DksA family transcriptional regulator [Amphritea sp. 1_MG-2023]